MKSERSDTTVTFNRRSAPALVCSAINRGWPSSRRRGALTRRAGGKSTATFTTSLREARAGGLG